jgi:hypothetical protein
VSTYPTAPAQGQRTEAAPAKPGTLTAAVGIAAVSGLAAVVNGAMTLAGAKDIAKELAAKAAAVAADALGGLPSDLGVDTSKVYDGAAELIVPTIQSRAYMVLVFGAALLLFGVFMRNAATWARVLVTISAVLTLGISGLIALDLGTGLMIALGWVAVLGSVVTIVMTWLSPNGRYAKARKQA